MVDWSPGGLGTEMSNHREDSPDWLRNFQASSHSPHYLSSDSESSQEEYFIRDESTDFERNSTTDRDEDEKKVLDRTVAKSASYKQSAEISPKGRPEAGDQKAAKRRKISTDKKTDDGGTKVAAEPSDKQARNRMVWMLSSDSESESKTPVTVEEVPSAHESYEYQVKKKTNPDFPKSTGEHSPKMTRGKSPKKQHKQADRLSPEKKIVKTYQEKEGKIVIKLLKGEGEDSDLEVAGEGKSEKHVEHHVSSALPLMLPEKVNRSKALVECEGKSIDLSGDVGAVGRVIISDNPSRGHEMLLDLKGTIYKTTIAPSRTFCVVSMGQSEAKIEAIMNDFIQLTPQSNVYDAETMVEGSLDGFSFDSENEADKMPKAATHQGDQNEGAEKQTNEKTKRRVEKKSGAGPKKVKQAAGAKQPKKRKPQAPKKSKAKKVIDV